MEITNICMNLLASSIALAGLIAGFLVFRWTAMDNYVDNRKILINSILEKERKKNPTLLTIVQGIGKKVEVKVEGEDLLILKDESDFIKFFSRYNLNAFKHFIYDIYDLRSFRKKILFYGMFSISVLFLLSLFYLSRELLNCKVFNSAVALKLSMVVFFGILVFTLCFLYKSILGKPKKFKRNS